VIALLAAAAASFLFIGLKAIQQRQVMRAQYARMPALSIGMAFCEIFIMANVVRSSGDTAGLVLLALAIGLGGGMGSIAGTWIHKRKHG
jgi:hypothetical protein